MRAAVRWPRMPVYTADALILRTYKLGRSRSDRGVPDARPRQEARRGEGCAAAASRFVGALEPLTRGAASRTSSGSSASWSGSTTSSRRGRRCRRRSARRSDYVGYFAELIDEWAPEADADERLYRLGASMLDALAAGAPVEPLARYFEYWLLRLQGVYPSLGACPGCGGPLRRGAVMPPREHVFAVPDVRAGGRAPRLCVDALQFLKAAGAVGAGSRSTRCR